MADDLIPINDEQAKAIQEAAKTATKALELTEKAGAYVGSVLGTVPADLIAVLGGDWLGQVRIRNLARYQDRTEEILRARGVTETSAVSPSLAVPLLRAAADESREDLQELWALLLAAAMDPKRSNRVRLSYIETVKRLHPLDAHILKKLYDTSDTPSPNARDFLAGFFKVSSREIEVSVLNLHDLKCVHLPISNETANFHMTSYGNELVRACSN
jgi:hypothetical protein